MKGLEISSTALRQCSLSLRCTGARLNKTSALARAEPVELSQTNCLTVAGFLIVALRGCFSEGPPAPENQHLDILFRSRLRDPFPPVPKRIPRCRFHPS